MKKPDDVLRQLFAIADLRFGKSSIDDPEPADPPQAPSTPVSLMITNRQRAQLRDLGFSDEAIAEMTPADAHRHLGL